MHLCLLVRSQFLSYARLSYKIRNYQAPDLLYVHTDMEIKLNCLQFLSFLETLTERNEDNTGLIPIFQTNGSPPSNIVYTYGFSFRQVYFRELKGLAILIVTKEFLRITDHRDS